MDQPYIYVVFFSTPSKVGKLIRTVTGETFNHISISLDRDMKQMYSFARRHYQLPLYGGFVKESCSRYHINGKAANIRICAIPVAPRQHLTLTALLKDMHRNNRFYIYNHLSALGAVIHRPIRAKDAYTCVEFCIRILRELGMDIQSGKYYAIGDILQLLEPYMIYEGAMPEAEDFDEAYYAKNPVAHPVYTTLKDMLKLLPRLKT